MNVPISYQNKPGESKKTLYTWKDKEGKIHFSNIGYPSKGYYLPITLNE